MSITRLGEDRDYETLASCSWDIVESSLRSYHEMTVRDVSVRLPQIPFMEGAEEVRKTTIMLKTSRSMSNYPSTQVVVEGAYVMRGFSNAYLSFNWGNPYYFNAPYLHVNSSRVISAINTISRSVTDPHFNYARDINFEGGEKGAFISLNLTQFLAGDLEPYVYNWSKLAELHTLEMAAYNEFVDAVYPDNYADIIEIG